MITPLLQTAFDPVFKRHRQVGRLRSLAIACFCASAGLAALWLAGVHRFWAVVAVLIVALIIRGILNNRADLAAPDYQALARRIEGQHPELHALLLTAVE